MNIKEIDSICRSMFPENGPGAAVIIQREENTIFDKGYGLANIEREIPANGDTFFNIASCSKQFTAVAILQLEEAGKLSLYDSVHHWFPEFEYDVWDRITLKHLLSHSSGVPDERGYLSADAKIYCDDRLATEYMSMLDHLNFEPGTAYEYINPTFTLCGQIIERASGKPFSAYMKENIFIPAGMKETLYFESDHQMSIPRRAFGYEISEDGKGWDKYEYGQEAFFATRPDGGIYSSAHELLLWERALKNCVLISADSLKLAQSAHIRVSGSPYSSYQNRPNTWYGLGWFIEPGCVYHTGDNGGFKSLIAMYPQADTFVCILSARNDWKRNTLKKTLEQLLFR